MNILFNIFILNFFIAKIKCSEQLFFDTLSVCQENCINICNSNTEIEQTACTNLCESHCKNYNSILNKYQVNCLLVCDSKSMNRNSCESICKHLSHNQQHVNTEINLSTYFYKANDNESEKKDNLNIGQGCTGFGREICYKLCRLGHKESIKICQCACCKCEF
jgi:hypothetical protein